RPGPLPRLRRRWRWASAALPRVSRRGRAAWHQLARIQWALKLPPPLSEDTESFGRPLPSTMTILVGPKFPIADPFALAVPKLARGRMPPLAVQQGAWAMTSAEEFAAPLSDVLTVWLQPCVVSDSTSV